MDVVHPNAMLANSRTVAATQAYLWQPDRRFTTPVTRTLIDTSQLLACSW
jgi:hypothetical protein